MHISILDSSTSPPFAVIIEMYRYSKRFNDNTLSNYIYSISEVNGVYSYTCFNLTYLTNLLQYVLGEHVTC